MNEKWLLIPFFSAPSHFTLSPAQLLFKVYSRLDMHSSISMTQHYCAASTLTVKRLSFSLTIFSSYIINVILSVDNIYLSSDSF